MKKTSFLLALLITTGSLFAQKKTTSTATVSFDATTAKDALPKADNKTVIGSLDTKTGAVAFEAAVKNFSFSNPMMQDHFNGPNWMNSTQFTKFTFTGTLEKLNKIKFTKDGTYKLKVNGNLTIKDVTKAVKAEGTITVSGGKIKADASFSIKLKDFNITGQPIEAGKVAEQPKITVSAEF